MNSFFILTPKEAEPLYFFQSWPLYFITSPGVSFVPESILPRKFKANGSMAIGLKDAELFLEEAKALNVPTWIGPRVLEMYQEAAAAGYKNLESMRMIEYVEKLAGGVVVKGRDVV